MVKDIKILFSLIFIVVPYWVRFSFTLILQAKQWQLSHTIRSLYVQWLSTLSSMYQLNIIFLSFLLVLQLIFPWRLNICRVLIWSNAILLFAGTALHLHQLTTSKNLIFQKESFCITCCEFLNTLFVVTIVTTLYFNCRKT